MAEATLVPKHFVTRTIELTLTQEEAEELLRDFDGTTKNPSETTKVLLRILVELVDMVPGPDYY